jgi:pimeloyl-ACP methyl ester carboxylesterase
VIAYQDSGGDGVPVVWVPGFASQVEIQRELPCWYGFIERMERFARLITFDKRGTGLSDRSLGVETLEDRMDDIRAVYDACDLDRASIVAVSEGGPLAILFAATWPERVSHLALYGTYAHSSLSADEITAFASTIESGWGTGLLDGLVVQHVDKTGREVLARFERYACTSTMAAAKGRSDASLDVRDMLGVVDLPTSSYTTVMIRSYPSLDRGQSPMGSLAPSSSSWMVTSTPVGTQTTTTTWSARSKSSSPELGPWRTAQIVCSLRSRSATSSRRLHGRRILETTVGGACSMTMTTRYVSS